MLKVCRWRKIGGGSFRWRGFIIKPNEVFLAAEEELPRAFRKNFILLPDVEGDMGFLEEPSIPEAENLRVYYVPEEVTSPRFAKAFATGSGGVAMEEGDYKLGSWAAFGTPMVWHGLVQSQKMGFDWYYGDHGYFNRGRSFRVTRNAYQMAYIQTDGYKESDENKKRLKKLEIKTSRWRKEGRNILICPPDPTIARVFHFSSSAWKRKIVKEVKQYTNRPIVFRERTAKEPLQEALQKAWFLITAFSNAAVEAVVAGVPVHCTALCGATPMATPLEDIEYPEYPRNRREWLLNLCANQWTLREIAQGACWDRIGRVA